MQFKVGNFKLSEIRMLTCTLKAVPIESYLAVFPTLKQGVIAGVFKIKGASLGLLPGQRRYKSPSSSPMNNRWMTGIQRSMLCLRCGLTSP